MTRPAIAILTVTLALGLGGGGVAWGRSVLFVGNVDEGTVTLVDMSVLRVLGSINVIPDGTTPRDPAQAAAYPALVRAKGTNYVQGLALSPDGQTLYVSRGFLGDVAAFRVAGGQMLWRVQTSSVRADHIGLSRDGRRLFVSALSSNVVQVIDTATHAFIGSFATGDWPHVIELSPNGRLVYNGSLGNQLAPAGADGVKQLTVADVNTLAVVRTYSFDVGVRPFTFTADGRTAYVQLSYLNGFEELDLASGHVSRTMSLPVMGPAVGQAPSGYPNQAAHHGIALSHEERLICDAATVSDYVALVSRPELRVVSIIPVGDQPAEAQTSADGRYCLVTTRGPGPQA
ncbi:MAG TPA: beta-propeller fold lactonase family protein, partial [Solirubrobacteraceae bacterium]|nr:beta-propeller fold lactonase family protein [Solirubrobacteraceae bacterium]